MKKIQTAFHHFPFSTIPYNIFGWVHLPLRDIVEEKKTIIGSDLNRGVSILKNGNLVAIPTETVYGLAGNGLNSEAVAKIFVAKNRPKFDPLILHIGQLNQAADLTSDFPEKAKQLATKFWPGPLTLILPKSDLVPDIVTSGLDSVGIRIPDHPLTLELLKSLTFPLAAPSANPFGYVSPTNAQHVKDQLDGKLEYILDGGQCKVGIESTIVSFVNNQITILRHGAITQKEIENVIGNVNASTQSSSRPEAPGMLDSHYSPKKYFILGDLNKLMAQYADKNFSVLAFSNNRGAKGEVLSKSKNLSEAAQNLFTALRNLDNDGSEVILAEEVPNEGIGLAINDKLRRASHTA